MGGISYISKQVFSKGYKASDFNEEQLNSIYAHLSFECGYVPWIYESFEYAWESFLNDGWRYDGATFVQEHNGEFWEVAAFIHDWMNHIGHIGKEVDLYFVKVMLTLGYSENIIFERCKWMQWTFLNVLWHKIKGTYKANTLPIIINTKPQTT